MTWTYTTLRQKRMVAIVKAFQIYVETYDMQIAYDNYEDRTFIDDMIYGIGVALRPEEWRYGKGYLEFKSYLRDNDIV